MTDRRISLGLTRLQAAKVLGVRPDDDEVTVVSAFRRRALAEHPDRGGDPAEFERSIEARSVLLGTATHDAVGVPRSRSFVRRRPWWRPWS